MKPNSSQATRREFINQTSLRSAALPWPIFTPPSPPLPPPESHSHPPHRGRSQARADPLYASGQRRYASPAGPSQPSVYAEEAELEAGGNFGGNPGKTRQRNKFRSTKPRAFCAGSSLCAARQLKTSAFLGSSAQIVPPGEMDPLETGGTGTARLPSLSGRQFPPRLPDCQATAAVFYLDILESAFVPQNSEPLPPE